MLPWVIPLIGINKYFKIYYGFMFYVLFAYLSVCLEFTVLITTELIKRSLGKFLLVGPFQRKKLLIVENDLDFGFKIFFI